MAKKNSGDSGAFCSFCGRDEKSVKLLMGGMYGFICEECAEQAYMYANEQLAEQQKKALDAKGLTLLKPKEITEFLRIILGCISETMAYIGFQHLRMGLIVLFEDITQKHMRDMVKSQEIVVTSKDICRIDHAVLETEDLMIPSKMFCPAEKSCEVPAHPCCITHKTVSDEEVIRSHRCAKHYIIIKIYETVREAGNAP